VGQKVGATFVLHLVTDDPLRGSIANRSLLAAAE
jgi:hypothetical protein